MANVLNWKHCFAALRAFPVLPQRFICTTAGRLNEETFANRKKSFINAKEKRFVDFKRVWLKGGDGGLGCVSWHQEPFERFATADGSHGGHGGAVIFRGDATISSLENILSSYSGHDGEHGRGKGRHGANAQDMYIQVPLGTLIMQNQEILRDMMHDGEEFIAATGGQGGRGNTHGKDFRREPNDERAKGKPGTSGRYELELKSLADIGLVGLPNAGKSSFLAAVSNAHPKIAPYPFTTLNPYLGVVDFPDFFRLTVADIPGIVPRAHLNVGLGLSFLRHIERSKILLFIVDMSGSDGSLRPDLALQVLRAELEAYQPGLTNRPAVVAANKMDKEGAEANLAAIEHLVGLPVMPICARTGAGIRELTYRLRALVEQLTKEEDERKANAKQEAHAETDKLPGQGT
eukprot:m.68127 g.68127  ORF g.68127 m.68127 type:complete len:404 (+) comp12754_c0_seq1:27-1238(+)